MPPALARKYATIESEAERLEVSTKTLRRMIARGQLTGYRFGDRMIRLDKAEVDAAMQPIPTVNGAA